MWKNSRENEVLGCIRPILSLCLLFLIAAAADLRAQSKDDFDSYKVRLEGSWVYSNPSGNVQGSTDSGAIDLKESFGFKSYSTFAGKLDWKFTRKNHLYFVGVPFNRSNETVLTRTIVFEGETFVAGLKTQSTLDATLYGIGYQYDIIRRKRGHLGIAAQFNLFDIYASINAAAQVSGDGIHYAERSASASLTALIPVAGPEFRLYLTNSPRLFIDGQIYGMYFFGYGNYVSSAADLGVSITRNVAIKAGYQVGSRLTVKNDSSTNRIGLRLTQQGPFAGIQFSF